MSDKKLLYECDMHVHSVQSACARRDMTLEAIADACVGRGIRYLGITDHISAIVEPEILWETRERLRGMDLPVEVYLGCEADILDIGRHTVTQEMIDGLDFVAVAANHFAAAGVAQPAGDDPNEVARHYARMFRYACGLQFADVIVHPMYAMPGSFDPDFLEFVSFEQLAEAIEAAKANEIAIEISPRSLAPEQMSFRLKFLRLCKAVGVKFSIGTDSHRLETVGNTRVLAPLIDEIGITDEDIWFCCGS